MVEPRITRGAAVNAEAPQQLTPEHWARWSAVRCLARCELAPQADEWEPVLEFVPDQRSYMEYGYTLSGAEGHCWLAARLSIAASRDRLFASSGIQLASIPARAPLTTAGRTQPGTGPLHVGRSQHRPRCARPAGLMFGRGGRHLDELPAALLAPVPEAARPAVVAWWAGLAPDERAAVAARCDDRWEACFFGPAHDPPVVHGGRFVAPDDA